MIKRQNKKIRTKKNKLAIIGLGYVGLPLAIEFGKKRDVLGFDINKDRITELQKSIDTTFEVSNNEFKKSINLKFTNNIDEIKNCKIFNVSITN